MIVFGVVDIECTGLDPENDAIVEIACVDVNKDGAITDSRESFVKPPIKIPPEASGIHNITDYDVRDADAARDVIPCILPLDCDVIYAAHNAAYEKSFLEPFIPGVKWICTYKSSLRIWPEAPNHKNNTLRYFLKLPVDRELADQTHRALADAHVTAHILRELLDKASIEDMLRWTSEPPLFPRCPIGDWRDRRWSEVERSFVDWIINKKGMDPDIVWNAQQELKRRSAAADAIISKRLADEKEARDGYIRIALPALRVALTISDLEQWFKDEKEHREKYRVVQGTPEYASIVAACAERKSQILATQTAEAA